MNFLLKIYLETMLVSEFKKQTHEMPIDTKVYCSYMKLEYTLHNFESSLQSISINTSVNSGALSPEWDRDSSSTITLEDLYKLADNIRLELDIEDGFVFSDVNELIVKNGVVVLFSK